MRFTTVIVSGGGNTSGIEVPESIVLGFDAGKRFPVVVTVNGFTYRSTVGPYKGPYLVSLSADNRAAAGVAVGDEVEVDLERDLAPREVEIPADLGAALDADSGASAFFQSLPPGQKKSYTTWIVEAKKEETRAARVAKAVQMLSEGMRR